MNIFAKKNFFRWHEKSSPPCHLELRFQDDSLQNTNAFLILDPWPNTQTGQDEIQHSKVRHVVWRDNSSETIQCFLLKYLKLKKITFRQLLTLF